jgi:AcrR family transcriptional regulator
MLTDASLVRVLCGNHIRVTLTVMNTSGTRAYRMTARAESAERTGERILQACADVFWERPTVDISLDEIAARAEVSVRTVIRRFGTKEELFAASAQWNAAKVARQRGTAPVGDVPGAVSVLLDHYEEYGDRVMRLLAAEVEVPALGPLVDSGRKVHADWCRRVFAPYLAGHSATERRRRLAQFTAICDVYTWKLLRRDARLGRAQTELALTEMLTPLTEES